MGVNKKVVKNLDHYGKKHKTLHHSHSGHLTFDEHVVKPVVVHKRVVVNKPVVVKKKFEVEKPVVVHKKVVVNKPVLVDSYKGQPSHYDQPEYDRELQNYPLVDEVEEDEGNDVDVIDNPGDKMDDGEIEVIEETDEDYPEQERDSQSYFHKKVHKHHGKKHKTLHHSHRHSHRFY